MILLETKISFLGQDQNGKVKNLKEVYLVEGETFSDGEKDLMKELENVNSFTTLSMKRLQIDEIISSDNENHDKFYLAKIKTTIFDTETGKESNKVINVIIQCDTLENSTKELYKKLEKSSDFVIKSVKETKVIDIFLKK